MAKKDNGKGSKNDIINFRAGSEEKKKKYKDRIKKVTESKNIRQIEIIENGLLVEEGKDEEQTFLNKKNRMKAIRNNALDEVIKANAVIEAYNKRLKDLNPNRYKFLNEEDNVIKLYDEKGNRII